MATMEEVNLPKGVKKAIPRVFVVALRVAKEAWIAGVWSWRYCWRYGREIKVSNLNKKEQKLEIKILVFSKRLSSILS
jgi:hypothetical protein